MAGRRYLPEVERVDGPTPAVRRGPGERTEPRPPALAQAAGNKAVTAVVRRSAKRPTVQRHSSWEHALMGDVKPGDLASATGRIAPANQKHVLTQEVKRVDYFRTDPRAVPKTGPGELFEGIQILKLTGSELYVTYGEVNALADYLPNGHDINTMSATDLIPILQHMRQIIAASAISARDNVDADSYDGDFPQWSGGQREPTKAKVIRGASAGAADLIVEDAATASRGFQRYSGLLSRNACHFAPMSWERWSQNHSRAVAEAQRAHGFRAAGDTRLAGSETQAWVHNGYADHFLEDSFAAGHLINKTMVMQWFMEYLRTRHPLLVKAQMPDADMAKAMNPSAQRHVAGQDLYAAMASAQAAEQGRPGPPPPKSVSTDLQTASEFRGRNAGGRLDATDRAALAGVRPVPGMTERQVSHQYQRFLADALLHMAAGQVHDHFNAMTTGGLLVENGLGMRFRVGGDNTQLALSDARGAQVVVEAVNLSRQVIAETLATGQSTVSGREVLLMVPTKVVLGSGAYDLETWNQTTIRDYCDKIFPEVYSSVSASIVQESGALPTTPDPDLADTR
ncbi:MAG: hypothetical protein V7637_3143 [Mycobacteriales bacterium]